MTMIDRFESEQLAPPPPPANLYFPVKVVLPGARELSTDEALERCRVDPERITAFASAAATLLAPVAAKDMKHETEAEVPAEPVVTDTRTRPEGGTVTVTMGPTVARST
jgi:hypothetical protein